jgi:hypothetical protein
MSAFLRKYNTATNVYIPIIKRAAVDFAVSADWTPAAGDVKISKDGGAAANVTNLPTAITMGNTAMWNFSLTAAEMQAAKVAVTVADSPTKAVEDTMFLIETYGNASAELSGVDFTDAVRMGLTALPNAAAEAAGGLYTRGSGAGQIRQDANGRIDVNVKAFGDSAGTFASGRPEVNTTHIAGSAVSTSTAQIGVNVVNAGGTAWGSGAITAAAFAAGAIDAAAIANGAIDRATFAADTGLVTIRSGTAQAGGGSTITLDASASATDQLYTDCRLLLTGGAGAGQCRRIRDYVGSTKVATVTNAWTTQPDATSTFAILPDASVWDEKTADHLDSGSTGGSLNAAGAAGDPWATAVPGAYGAGTAGYILGVNLDAAVTSRLAPTVAGRTLDVSSAGEAGVDWANVGGQNTTVALSGTTVKTATDVETDTQDIQGRLPAALVGGRLDANVGAISSDTAAADNLEALLDGTGGVTLVAAAFTLTTPINADAVRISGDSAAADNCELFFDGTGYNAANSTVGAVTTVGTVNVLAAGSITAAVIATGAIDADALAADVVNDIWMGSTLTEAYATDGAAATPAQLLYMIWSALAEFSISSTTITCKKLDGATTAMTFTLDSASAPTSRTRAT